MKKIKISVAALVLAGVSLTFSNCVGSFALTSNVLQWNKNVGNRFVKELVFIAFWILPVYEVSALADLIVLNSIEFWGNKNPLEAYSKKVTTAHGTFIIDRDKDGYTILNEQSGLETRLIHSESDNSWSISQNGVSTTFLTFIDVNHVRMITADGGYRTIELSESGLMAYQKEIQTMQILSMK